MNKYKILDLYKVNQNTNTGNYLRYKVDREIDRYTVNRQRDRNKVERQKDIQYIDRQRYRYTVDRQIYSRQIDRYTVDRQRDRYTVDRQRDKYTVDRQRDRFQIYRQLPVRFKILIDGTNGCRSSRTDKPLWERFNCRQIDRQIDIQKADIQQIDKVATCKIQNPH